jgi:hypothetical protein
LNLRGRDAGAQVRGEIAGAAATDPKIRLPRGLWVYATRDGVSSGREIAWLVELHVVYRSLCGGVAAPITASTASAATRASPPARFADHEQPTDEDSGNRSAHHHGPVRSEPSYLVRR